MNRLLVFGLGMVVGTFTSVSIDPPLVGFFPDKKSTSWPLIEKAGRFCVNVMGSDQQDVCRSASAKGDEKFVGVEFTIPLLEQLTAEVLRAETLTAVFTATSMPGAAGSLAVIASVAALATPAWLYARFLRQRVWPNSPQALAWSRNVGMTVSVGACAYAATYLLGRVFDLALGEGDGPNDWGRVAPWLIGMIAAVAAWYSRVRKTPARARDLVAPEVVSSAATMWVAPKG